MRRPLHLILFAVVGVALIAGSGCAGARVVGVEAPKPGEGTLIVHAETNLLWPHEKDSEIVVRWGEWEGRGPVFMSPTAPQPETIKSHIREWRKVRTGRAAVRLSGSPPPSRDVVQVQFVFRHQVLSERLFPVPKGLPGMLAAEERGGGSADPDPRPRTPSGWPKKGAVLSANIDHPTRHDHRRELVCRLDQSMGPVYAMVTAPAGTWKVTIDIRSHSDPRLVLDITPWWVELLDAEGVPTGTKKHSFIESGNELRSVEYWELDGRPAIIKLTSGSKPGDSVRVRFERADDPQ